MFYNDEYTLDIDDLGYKKQADTVREIILKCQTPYTLGISGKWGSGKTSLMKYIMASLGGEPLKYRIKYSKDFVTELYDEQKKFHTVRKKYSNDYEHIHTVWFNPWEHEDDDEPFIALLKEIRNHFDLINKSMVSGKKIAYTSLQAGLDMIGTLISVGRNQGTNIVNIGEKYEFDNFEYTSRKERFRLIFQEAVTKFLTITKNKNDVVEENAKLVIFIDDLDRCEEATIAKLLKEIKQHLATHRCVFIFGYDRHHVEKSLSSSLSRSAKETRAYLEKLFQTTLYIKEPLEINLKTFIKKHLQSLEISINAGNLNLFVDYLKNLIDANPRRFKTYLNALYLHIQSSDFRNTNPIELDDLKKLSLITYLKVYYEPVYSALENKPSLLPSIISVCKNKDRTKISNQKEHFIYLEFAPHIHEIDSQAYVDEKLRSDLLKNDKSIEIKFLTEIYEMQGKYRSFEFFSSEFEIMFLVYKDSPNEIKLYL